MFGPLVARWHSEYFPTASSDHPHTPLDCREEPPLHHDDQTLRATRADLLAFAVAALSCRSNRGPIPAVDGPLALEVRYPTSRPIPPVDSISVWGTVGTGRATLRINGLPIAVAPNGGFAAYVAVPRGPRPVLQLEAAKGRRKARKAIPLTYLADPPPDPVRPIRRWVRLRRLPNDSLDRATEARPIYSRATPGGALAVPLDQGLRLPAEAETDDAVQLRLAKDLLVWVPRAETEVAPAPAPKTLEVGSLRLTTEDGRITLELPVREPLPATVELADNRLSWTLYGGKPTSTRPVTARRGIVERAVVKDHHDGRTVVTVSLREPPLGWRVGRRSTGATLEIRPLPKPSIKGLVVVLDPGHPPEGTTGPTGLREDSVTLAVARAARPKLTALGARVVLTRADSAPVSLEARTAIAEGADATVLVSIHVNAPAEGQPPGSSDGTRVYWFQPTSPPLARALRDSVATAMGQSRGGTPESNLAVLRSSWFPSVLIEATALSLPIREAALRSPRGIEAYAEGIVAGLRAWITGLH